MEERVNAVYRSFSEALRPLVWQSMAAILVMLAPAVVFSCLLLVLQWRKQRAIRAKVMSAELV